jgi:hypothetical protein
VATTSQHSGLESTALVVRLAPLERDGLWRATERRLGQAHGQKVLDQWSGQRSTTTLLWVKKATAFVSGLGLVAKLARRRAG